MQAKHWTRELNKLFDTFEMFYKHTLYSLYSIWPPPPTPPSLWYLWWATWLRNQLTNDHIQKNIEECRGQWSWTTWSGQNDGSALVDRGQGMPFFHHRCVLVVPWKVQKSQKGQVLCTSEFISPQPPILVANQVYVECFHLTHPFTFAMCWGFKGVIINVVEIVRSFLLLLSLSLTQIHFKVNMNKMCFQTHLNSARELGAWQR